MPGIVGIISQYPRESHRSDLGIMLRALLHEPSYTSGTFVDETVGLYAGWACHEGSFSDCLPLFNEKKDIVVFLSGETFVDASVIEGLKDRGHELDRDNASYLVHLYEEEGEAFIQGLNGCFSGILVDFRQSKVILFNDRYGMGRIYYHEGREEFLFSSEAKSLLKIRRYLRNFDTESMAQLFVCDCVLQNRTLFPGVMVLPAASLWSFAGGKRIEKRQYFDSREWEGQPVLESGPFLEEIQETFHRILPRYFRARQPIAISLTSGLDSRAILAHVDGRFDDIPCFTFGGMDREILDARIARTIASRTGRSYQLVSLKRGFFSDFPEHAARTVYISDGCHDVCGSHDVILNREARRIAPIRMTGKFGSEVVGGHSLMRKPLVWERGLLHPDMGPLMGRAADQFREIRHIHPQTFTAFREVPWHEYGRVAIESAELTLRTPFMDNDLVKLMYRSPRGSFSPLDVRLVLAKHAQGMLRDVRTDRGTAGRPIPLVSGGLRFLLYALFKMEYIYLYSLPHWMARLDALLRPLAPQRLLAGRYQLTSYRLWFRDELSNYVKEVLLDPRATSRTYLNRGTTERIVRGHIDGRANYMTAINKLMTVELIQRLLIEDR